MTTRKDRIGMTVGLFCAILAAAVPTAATPYFVGVYDSFGASLPVLTRLLVDHGAVVWLLPVLVMLAWFARPGSDHRGKAPLLVGMVGLFAVVPVTVYALYVPILALAAG
ncbi:hypothetical protein [Marilutibacter chinensis]|uniref:DUF2834 domain-containing protein n=1 Tax=Marilutibacter chinensis TaxID=2912247 RepID=A0ABS9HU80_9GAMM|nr:hypothetical protein [Lysobacter chinensis]MCF7221868.1 hypothetical protein [Lysobacter chinensis]